MLSPAIARELRERGHDVLAVADHPGWVALSDPEVMALARTERRAVVINNLRSPDLISVEEVQDNTGPTDNGVVDASTTWGRWSGPAPSGTPARRTRRRSSRSRASSWGG